MLAMPLPESAPAWIELIPAGPNIVGIDGRHWVNSNPGQIVSTANSQPRPLVIDYEHASEHRAPHGLDAPAAGWINRLEMRGNGAIWGRVEWTAKARAYIADKAYRFISPVFTFEKATQRIVALTSAGLTNQPNLNLTALNTRNKGELITAECRQVFSTNAALRSEFGDVETFHAYHRAIANGATIVKGKSHVWL